MFALIRRYVARLLHPASTHTPLSSARRPAAMRTGARQVPGRYRPEIGGQRTEALAALFDFEDHSIEQDAIEVKT